MMVMSMRRAGERGARMISENMTEADTSGENLHCIADERSVK